MSCYKLLVYFMESNIRIRAFKPSDTPVLVEVLKLNVPRYFAESEIDDFKNYLLKEAEQYFVIENAGKIIGAGGINFTDGGVTGIISWDFIHPNFHRKGIGTQLLQHRLQIFRKLKSVENVVVRTSQHTYRFYEKNGFVLQEIQKDYWAQGFDMYKMTYV